MNDGKSIGESFIEITYNFRNRWQHRYSCTLKYSMQCENWKKRKPTTFSQPYIELNFPQEAENNYKLTKRRHVTVEKYLIWKHCSKIDIRYDLYYWIITKQISAKYKMFGIIQRRIRFFELKWTKFLSYVVEIFPKRGR